MKMIFNQVNGMFEVDINGRPSEGYQIDAPAGFKPGGPLVLVRYPAGVGSAEPSVRAATTISDTLAAYLASGLARSVHVMRWTGHRYVEACQGRPC